MKAFEYVRVESSAQAVALLHDGAGDALAIAGGTDLLAEVKEGIVSPATLVSLAAIPELQGMELDSDGLTIGAATTLAEIESRPDIAGSYPLLAQAVSSVATPQVRNVGTIGGNLCQRPRCWYYRSTLFDCLKKGGSTCFAVEGESKYHAIIGATDCHIVHPSDVAVALVSLNADVALIGPDGRRELKIIDFFHDGAADVTSENVLKTGEILESIKIPAPVDSQRSAYIKAKERPAMDFALSSVAAVLDIRGDTIQRARITLGGVAPLPYVAHQAEDMLAGKRVDEVDAGAVGGLAVADARPLRDNHYKVRMTASIVSRAISDILQSLDGSSS
ncbi:MAG: xanthine dehydrogenase family protein subunit M [Chloroflexi bacterium]|nr:xanthine dehydrogenase family protein subunit M [Chloroflexota bacterium]